MLLCWGDSHSQMSSPMEYPSFLFLPFLILGPVYTMYFKILLHWKIMIVTLLFEKIFFCPVKASYNILANHYSYNWMTEAVESLCILCGAFCGGERGVEDVERSDGQLALHLGGEEEAAAECLTVNKHSA